MKYEESLKVMRDNKNVIDYAKMVSFEEGEAKGKLEGKLEGKIEGKLEGEHEARIKIALNALQKNLPISFITELTGLSEQEVKKLKKK
jgi:predicted transposase/invertase (TIGR01784 family)